MKKCSKCGEEKQSTDFYSDKRHKDGLESHCKRCRLKATSSYKKTEKGKKAQSKYSRTEKGKKARSKYSRTERGKKADAKAGAKYSRTEKGKKAIAKKQAKRKRDLGFILINSYFSGCNMHHLNETYVLAIPASLHRKYYHNHKDLDSMEEINHAAISWYYSY